MTTVQSVLPYFDFFADIQRQTKSDVTIIKIKFPQFCQEDSVLDDDQMNDFLNIAEWKIRDKTAAKIFSLVISSSLVRKISENPSLLKSEIVRAYVVLRYCDDEKKNCKEVVVEIKRAKIDEEFLRYKFASHLARRDPNDLAENIRLFSMKNPFLIRRIAEKVLRFKPNAFFGCWSDFRKHEVIFDEFYLRELVRSGSPIEELLEEDDFINSFENTSSLLIQAIYEKFEFGKEFIQMFKEKRKCQREEKELFDAFIRNPYARDFYKVRELGRLKIFDSLSSQERSQLVAMLLLLKHSKYDALEEDQRATLLDFLDEINKFPDPRVRFAFLALFLDGKKRELPAPNCLLEALGSVHSQKFYPKMYLLIHYQFRLRKIDTTCLPEVWKSEEFRKNFPLFLVELLFSTNVDDFQRSSVLSRIFQQKQFPDFEMLRHLSYCINRGLIEDFITKETSPLQIVTTNFQNFLERLGKPYNCSLSLELATNLQSVPDIISYSQSLARLPDSERERMVKFFFQFLHSMAKNTMKEERFNTPALKHLFDDRLTGPRPRGTPLDLNVWKEENILTIGDIKRNFPTFFLNVDIAEELRNAFKERLLEENGCLRFYHHLNGNPWQGRPTLSKAAIDYRDDRSDTSKKEILRSVLLLELFEGVSTDNPTVQLGDERKKQLLAQLKKISSDESALFIEELAKKFATMLQEKKFDEHKIIKINDPYQLFLIGSIGQTCQRVDGDPANNKCLLAYPCDGKNAVICAINEKGKIAARAIIRFFYAKTNDEDAMGLAPILHLEPIYYSASKDDILKTGITLSLPTTSKQIF
ncbi:MAG: hypothetical protein LVR00_02725 [Rhabdochlamydiaceae bacterium]|jgi:hypothetical protein